MKTSKKGISLIVLIITIVVMIILASAIILTINSDRTITKAKEARNVTDLANAKDIVSVAKGEWVLDKNIIMEDDTTITSFEDYAKKKLKESGYNVTEGAAGAIEVTEKGIVYAYPEIPEGFTVSIYPGEQKISEGLVVYKTDAATLSTKTQAVAQTTYDQFVWIPVPDITKFVRTNWLNKDNFEVNYTEPYSSGYATEVAEYNKMKASVERNGGFYIARYEAGKETIDNVDTVVSKKGATVWNNVKWGDNMTTIGTSGAVYRSQRLYPENGSSNVVSTLCYSVQWDAAMNFMKDVPNPNVPGKKYIEDSTGMGVYNTSAPAETGSNDAYKVKNIYDMAGNVFEWTMEAKSTGRRVVRGGYYSVGGTNDPASSRNSNLPDNAFGNYGFRPALYLK